MAWGYSSVPKPPPPPKSAFSKVAPLLIFLIILGGAAFVCYHLYLASLKISQSASDKLSSKNITFSKDGLKVGVKEVKNENYVDATQGFLVKAWNLSSWPEYKSRYWNKGAQEGAEKRKPYSRTTSSSK